MTGGVAIKVNDHAAGSSAHQHGAYRQVGARAQGWHAGRVLSIVTTRANAELADPQP